MIVKNYQLAIAFSLLVGLNVVAADEAGEGTAMIECQTLHGDAKRNNACTHLTHSAKKGWSSLCHRVAGYSFIIGKTIVDAATLYTTLLQMGAIENYGMGLGITLVTKPCAATDDFCLNNREDQVNLLKGAYLTDAVVTAGFSGVAIVLDLASLVAYACSSQASLKGSCAGSVVAASGFVSLASMTGALAANGCLWDTDLAHKNGLPAQVVESLDRAIRKGIPVVVLDSVSGIAGTVVGCLILAK